MANQLEFIYRLEVMYEGKWELVVQCLFLEDAESLYEVLTEDNPYNEVYRITVAE